MQRTTQRQAGRDEGRIHYTFRFTWIVGTACPDCDSCHGGVSGSRIDLVLWAEIVFCVYPGHVVCRGLAELEMVNDPSARERV